MSGKKELIQLDAVIADMIDESAFTAELANGYAITAYLPKGRRELAAKIQPGHIVRVELSPYDMSKGCIM